MKQTIRIACCGVMTALGIVILLLSSIIPVATYALSAIAGILGIVLVIEAGIGWAVPMYVATSLVSFFVVPDKEVVLVYILFAGYYPIVKSPIEKIRIRIFSYVIKFAIFNAAAIGAFFLAVYVFLTPLESFTIFGVFLPWVLLLIANVVFFVYDFAISGLVATYYRKLHPLIRKWFQS